MEATSSRTACHSRDSNASSPRPACHDSNDILQDTFFDHSQQLDSTTFDALLDTTFDAADDDASTSASATTVKTARQPSYTEEKSHRQRRQQSPQSSSARSTMAFYNPDDDATMQSSSPHRAFTTLSSHAHASPMSTTPNYHTMSAQVYQTNQYEQTAMTHNSLPMRLNGLPYHINQWHPYSNPASLPSMGDFTPTMTPLQQQHLYSQPAQHVEQRQATVDLLGYDDVIPEEDEMDEAPNAMAADPCYAQLLYRCLLDAPNHTMCLKDVYHWVSQHSQKARDPSSTGWQNSVRHNLSMNAVSHLEPSTHPLLYSASR